MQQKELQHVTTYHNQRTKSMSRSIAIPSSVLFASKRRIARDFPFPSPRHAARDVLSGSGLREEPEWKRGSLGNGVKEGWSTLEDVAWSILGYSNRFATS